MYNLITKKIIVNTKINTYDKSNYNSISLDLDYIKSESGIKTTS